VNGGNLFVESIKVTTLSDIAEKQKIEDYSFAGCDGFVELIIPFGMTSIGTGAFQNCKNIRKVSIPESIISIGRNAFENCYGLKEVNISNPKTIIEQNAFMNSGIREIDIPTGNGQIADGIFNRCKNLKKLTIPEGIVSIKVLPMSRTIEFNTLENSYQSW
jgi:hypothetical protein